MDAIVVPALDLGGAATVAAGAAAVAAGQAALAAAQEATPRSTVQQLMDNGLMPQRVIRRLSQTARRASMSVIVAQQEWLMRNIELYSPSAMSPRSPLFSASAGVATEAAPAVMARAKTLGEMPQALVEGRLFFSAKLSAAMAAASGALVWCGVSQAGSGGPSASEIEASQAHAAAPYTLIVAVLGALLLFGTAGFLAGRTSAPVRVEVGWRREESGDVQGDGSKKKRGRLQRVG